MMKFLCLILFLSLNTFSQSLSFGDGKNINLDELKKTYKSEKVSVYNFHVNRSESYLAFDLKKILRDMYGQKMGNFFGIKVDTEDKYSPIIEMYKFEERKPFLAYARADQSTFTTIKVYKDKVINLGPFYLIWEEDYKKDAAKRRDHWPYKVTGFSLVNEPPQHLRPGVDADENIVWGYKNFLKQCIACHRIDGFGGTKSIELISNGLIKKKTDDYLFKFISNPRKVNPKSKMEPFPTKIDIRKKRITNIIQYLRYLQSAKDAPPKRKQTVEDLENLLQN